MSFVPVPSVPKFIGTVPQTTEDWAQLYKWMNQVKNTVNALGIAQGNAFSGTIVIPPLNPIGGTEGSVTVVNGLATAYTAPT
jgi:hypothetical protein